MKLKFDKQSMMPLSRRRTESGNPHSRRIMAKTGKCTRTRFGYLNEIRSCTARYLSRTDTRAIESEHVCIIPLRPDRFAAPGDSGSVAFDLGGQVVGMITNLGAGGLVYADPIEWILDAVEEKLGITVQVP